MTDFLPERLTDADIERYYNQILAIFKENKLAPLEVKYILTQVWDRIEKELENANK